MQYNPDLDMVVCDDCEEWYHLACIGRGARELEAQERYVCAEVSQPNSACCGSTPSLLLATWRRLCGAGS